jgi:CRP/FNR family transcriptional regulator, cyclic AMP receptor protein
MSATTTKNEICRLLVEDPDLAEAIPPNRRGLAMQELTADCIRLPAGPWRTPKHTENGALGLIVLEGLIIRHVDIDGRLGIELLGETDLLRPWQGADAAMIPLLSEWTVLQPAKLARLDNHFALQFARYPELVGRLLERSLRRSRHLATNLAIVHQPRVDIRLRLLLWHLAGRWGRVRRDGVFVPIKLTHAMLAHLVAARRPTVTSALSDLSRRGLVRALDDGWMLYGEAPTFVEGNGTRQRSALND